jgi:hypothetical protein
LLATASGERARLDREMRRRPYIVLHNTEVSSPRVALDHHQRAYRRCLRSVPFLMTDTASPQTRQMPIPWYREAAAGSVCEPEQ